MLFRHLCWSPALQMTQNSTAGLVLHREMHKKISLLTMWAKLKPSLLLFSQTLYGMIHHTSSVKNK